MDLILHVSGGSLHPCSGHGGQNNGEDQSPLNPPPGLAAELIPTGREQQCLRGKKLRRQQLHQSASTSTGSSAVRNHRAEILFW